MNFSRTKELCCETHILNTPIRDEDLEKIEIGDIVYLNGALITAVIKRTTASLSSAANCPLT